MNNLLVSNKTTYNLSVQRANYNPCDKMFNDRRDGKLLVFASVLTIHHIRNQ